MGLPPLLGGKNRKHVLLEAYIVSDASWEQEEFIKEKLCVLFSRGLILAEPSANSSSECML